MRKKNKEQHVTNIIHHNYHATEKKNKIKKECIKKRKHGRNSLLKEMEDTQYPDMFGISLLQSFH